MQQVAVQRARAQRGEPHPAAPAPRRRSRRSAPASSRRCASVITGPLHHGRAQLLGAVAVVEPRRRSSAAPPSRRRPARPANTGTDSSRTRRRRTSRKCSGLMHRPSTKNGRNCRTRWRSRSSPMSGETRRQRGDAEGDRHRPAHDPPQRGGQPPDEQRDQEPGQVPGVQQADRYAAGRRRPSRLKRVYAVSKTTYGTATPVTSRLSRSGRDVETAREVAGDDDERRHVEGVHERCRARPPARLPSRSGSQACPIATSTIARYLALSKNASRPAAGVVGVAGVEEPDGAAGSGPSGARSRGAGRRNSRSGSCRGTGCSCGGAGTSDAP